MSQIVIVARSDETLHMGGDTVQSQAIEQFLRVRGFDVRRVHEVDHTLTSSDLVILFNLTRPMEVYIHARACQDRGIRYILFPVYWDLDSLHMTGTPRQVFKSLIPPYLRDVYRTLWQEIGDRAQGRGGIITDSMSWSTIKMARYVLEHAYLVCPNSHAEMEHIVQKFRFRPQNMLVIYNGLEPLLEPQQLPDNVRCLLPESQYLLCMGAIGPRKNQLSLVRASRAMEIYLVILGGAARGCDAYATRVMSEAGDNVIFIPAQSHSIAMEILRRSHAHVQPSFIETPGLASLEAASLGLPIGVADVPPVREYFHDYAFYCDPLDERSIAVMLGKLQQSDYHAKERSDYVIERYSWDIVLDPFAAQITEMLYPTPQF